MVNKVCQEFYAPLTHKQEKVNELAELDSLLNGWNKWCFMAARLTPSLPPSHFLTKTLLGILQVSGAMHYSVP